MNFTEGSQFDIEHGGRIFRVHSWTDHDFEPPAFTVEVWCKSDQLLCGLEGHDCCGAEPDGEHLNLSCWHTLVDWVTDQSLQAFERGDYEAYVNALIEEHVRRMEAKALSR